MTYLYKQYLVRYLNMTLYRIFACSFMLLLFISLPESKIYQDKKYWCADDATSCKLSSGEYGCCPLPSAECCADGLHCCPNGTQCHNKEGSCLQINQLDHSTKLKLFSNEICPDKNQTCRQFETCCKERSGTYGCCPYNLAVCCSDLLHCCPHGTKCDLAHKQCLHPSNQINDKRGNLAKRMRIIGYEAHNSSNIVCPGGRYDCPDGNTCCQINESEWGCCPLENAVCCSDGIHCCPKGYKCSKSGCQSLRSKQHFYSKNISNLKRK